MPKHCAKCFVQRMLLPPHSNPERCLCYDPHFTGLLGSWRSSVPQSDGALGSGTWKICCSPTSCYRAARYLSGLLLLPGRLLLRSDTGWLTHYPLGSLIDFTSFKHRPLSPSSTSSSPLPISCLLTAASSPDLLFTSLKEGETGRSSFHWRPATS